MLVDCVGAVLFCLWLLLFVYGLFSLLVVRVWFGVVCFINSVEHCMV